MSKRTIALATLVAAGLLVGGTASADPAGGKGIVGLKLIIVDKYTAAGKAKLVFVAKDKTLGAIHKGVSVEKGEPPNITGTAEVIDQNDPSNRAVFDLPETGDKFTGTWLVNKEKVAKYVNKGAAPGDKGVKVAVVKPDKLLKVVAKNLGDDDDASGDQSDTDFDAGAIEEGDTIRVVVTLDNANPPADTHVMCTDLVVGKVKQIAGDTGFKVISKKDSTAPADGSCGGSSVSGAILEFVTGAAGGQCGETRQVGGTVLKNLTCGGLNVGGGCAQEGGACGVAEGPTPEGSPSSFNAACVGDTCTITARTAAESGTNTNCSDTGCRFGAFLSIPNGGTSTCVLNTFASPGSGTLDLATGAFDGSIPLTSAVTLTGNGTEPCPDCNAGACDPSAANPGASCTAINGDGDNYECLPAGVALTPFGVDLTPISTGTVSMDTTIDDDQVPGGVDGEFCPGQDLIEPGTIGCFGSAKLVLDASPNPVCAYIEENGTAGGAMSIGGGPVASTLASVFCIPAAGNVLIDGAADLPGPGAVSLPGTAELF